MADVVDSLVLFDGDLRHVVRLTNVSDGTGETDIVKVDASTLTSHGKPVTHFVVEEIEWNIQGFSSVLLSFDATANDELDVLSGGGYKDYRDFGGLKDPQSAGSTGDILLSTAGTSSTATYDITLHLRKKT